MKETSKKVLEFGIEKAKDGVKSTFFSVINGIIMKVIGVTIIIMALGLTTCVGYNYVSNKVEGTCK